MSIEALLQTPVVAPAWKGQWARVWLRPDIFSAQEFIIGALAFTEQGLSDFRVLTSPDRFACIYGDGAKALFERLFADLRRLLADARARHMPFDALALPDVFRLEPVGSLRTQLPGEALERMLRDGTIPMEQEEPAGKRKRFAARDPEEVVRDVLDQVRLRAGFDASRFIREDYFGDQAHQVGVNLVTDRGAGVVASGWYAGSDRIQLEFLLGASKVEAYVAATNRDRERSAIFFLRPTEAHGLPPAVWRDAERQLDTLQWRLEQQRFRVVTHDEPAFLAEQVVEWSRTAA